MKDTGGSAFPGKICTGYEVIDGTPIYEYPEGMTLRDYFAAKGMQTMVGMITGETTEYDIERIPASAYSYADDMIKERSK